MSAHRRKKTLRLPLSNDHGGQDMGFLVALERETTQRFITPPNHTPTPAIDDSDYYFVELSHV